MQTFNCTKGCGECCGIQPVTQKQLDSIRKALKKMPKHEINRLKRQQRDPLGCPLRDVEKDRCSVYMHRPEICKMFGYYEGLQCPHFPEFATGSREDGLVRIQESTQEEQPVGILGMDITWEKGLLVK